MPNLVIQIEILQTKVLSIVSVLLCQYSKLFHECNVWTQEPRGTTKRTGVLIGNIEKTL